MARALLPAVALLLLAGVAGASTSTAQPAELIAFADGYGRSAGLFVVRPDSTGGRRIGSGGAPAWSPDGRRIAFHRYVGGGRNSEIFLMDAAGRGVRRLTSAPAEDLAPAWSPDGRRIIFVSTRSGAWEIHVMSADGGAVRRITRRRSRG